MRGRWGLVAVVVVAAALLAAFLVGRRVGGDAARPAPPGAGSARLRVAAWVQDWPEVAPDATTIHVAPSGAGDACTEEVPCDLRGGQVRARALAPTAPSDVVVSLAGGTYEMVEPLRLGPEDSGRDAAHRVVYRAAPGEVPVLDGGRAVTGWRPAADRPGTWVADVGAGTTSRLLTVDGVRGVRARGPTDPPGWTRTERGFRAPDGAATWARPDQVEVVSHAEWRSFRCPVGAVEGAEVHLAEPCWRQASAPERFGMDHVTWVENAVELLDEPGEWYLDPDAGRLWAIPRPGQDLATATASLAMPGPLVEIRGTPAAPVHDVGLVGLELARSGWDAPSSDAGFVGTQAGWHRGPDAGADPLDAERIPGAVSLAHARHVRIERSTFTHLGGAGLDLAAGSQDVGVIGNRFTDVSATAVQAGETRQGAQNPVPADQLDRLHIADNLIDAVAVEYPDGAGIFASYVANASVLHNELSRLPWSGIAVGWGWGTDSYARNNLIAGNRITDVVTTLQDGGAIYTLSPMPGSVIERNHVVDQRNRSGALFLDEGTAFVTVADNVIERVPRWLHIWTASVHDNVVVDNASTTDAMLDAGTRNLVARNHTDPTDWPPAASQVVAEAGLEPAFADLRTRR